MIFPIQSLSVQTYLTLKGKALPSTKTKTQQMCSYILMQQNSNTYEMRAISSTLSSVIPLPHGLLSGLRLLTRSWPHQSRDLRILLLTSKCGCFWIFWPLKERTLSWAYESTIGRRSAVPTEFCFVFRENFQGLSLSSSGKSLVSAENGWVSLGHQSLEDSSQGFPGIPGVLEEGMEEIGYTTLVAFYVKRTISQNTIFGKNLPLLWLKWSLNWFSL